MQQKTKILYICVPLDSAYRIVKPPFYNITHIIIPRTPNKILTMPLHIPNLITERIISTQFNKSATTILTLIK